MKRFLLSLALVGALVAPAFAQVNVVPQVGVASGIVKKATYSSVALALPPAASATDIACITGSSTKTITVNRISISGTAGTLVTAPFTLVRRAAANTAGTAATTTANWANNIAKHDTSDAAATATLISYSANPTITDAAPTYLMSDSLTLPVTSAGVATVPLRWEPDTQFTFLKGWVLRGAAQQLCVNLNAVSVSSGLLYAGITWTEE